MSAITKVEKEKVNATKTKNKLTLGFINGTTKVFLICKENIAPCLGDMEVLMMMEI